jgi:hypothetical protein
VDGAPALLAPDLGGQLLDSRLRVYDLAGLCDRTIAGALSNAGGTPRLHDYILDEVRPTFVHISGSFVRLSGLHADPRFSRDYAPLHEDWSRRNPVVRRGTTVQAPWWGDYVRRDALGRTTLEDLRDAHRQAGLADWRVWEAPPAGTWPASPAAIARIAGWLSGEPLPARCGSATLP